jgi:transposase
VLAALQALRGVARVTALGLVAEIGDLPRFAHPRQPMAYLGLVPSERSSGQRVRRGSITKTGNSHARRLLTEVAWSYRHSARIGRDALQRQERLSQPVRQTAWKAQLRLTRRFALPCALDAAEAECRFANQRWQGATVSQLAGSAIQVSLGGKRESGANRLPRPRPRCPADTLATAR